MTGQKGIITILIVSALAVAGIWLNWQRQADEQPAPATVSNTQPSAEPDAEPGAGTDPEPEAATTPEPDAATTPEPSEPTNNGADMGTQPALDTRNWACTAWDDTAGARTDETCTQWSVQRGAATE